LSRVTDRVTGIVGGCLCPANPLVPGTSPPSGPADNDEVGSDTPQAPLCPCERFRGNDPPRRGPNGAVPPPNEEPPPEEPPADDPRIDVNLPDLPGDADEIVNGIIDQVLQTIDDNIVDPLEDVLPIPSLPPLPL
jgi:hypothetical protein